ncbi:hypothetical protein CR194_11065 [Salipaludibacillus keqinensis]|uniref:SSD domain-containing protein n=1 Tax=Salipaludibacillus keqinensis TaxID=2045207 RepID=A0A323TFJ9_9BACI|nr:MMPL family transporter [Salipaludibacillus keqinensis]PYZ93688.1 hypothetical protein CR194_11065 [Salipaludibacillus keqinensis]
MSRYYRWIYALPIIWIVCGIWLFIISPDMDQLVREQGQFSIPDEYSSAVTEEILKDNESTSGESILVVYHDEQGITELQKQDVHTQLESIGTEIKGFPVEEVLSPLDSEEQEEYLISSDGTTMMALLTMDINLNDIPLVRNDLEEEVAVEGIDHFVSGSSIIEDDVIISSEEGLAKTEIITVIFVVTILFLVFRSFAAPFIPLITVGATYFVTVSIVALLIDSFQFPVSNFTQIFIVAILFGIGTDYCILLLTRFKEELYHGADRLTAMMRTYRAVGTTVFSSALTGFIGFAAIGLADFDLYQSAVGVAVGIIILIAALWIWIPAAMLLLGEKLFWPSKAGLEATQSKLWGVLGRFSIYKPGWTLMLLSLVLIPAALFYDQKLSYNSLDEISSDYPSVHAVDLVSEKFGEGHSFPVNVVIESDAPWDQPSMMPYIELISAELTKIDSVEEVRSVTRPEGIIIEDFRIPVIAENLADGLSDMEEGLEGLYDALIEIHDDIRGQEDDLADASTGVNELMNGTADLQEGQEQLADAVDETSEGTINSAEGLTQLRTELSTINEGIAEQLESNSLPAELSQSLLPFSNGITELTGGFQEVDDGLRSLAENQRLLAEELRTLATGLDALQSGQRDMGEAFEGIQGGYDELADAMLDLADGVEEIQQGLTDTEDILNEIAEQPVHPLEGFFVPQAVFDDGDMEDLIELFMTPNQQVALFEVVLAVNPYSNEAIEIVEAVESQLANALAGTALENTRYSVGGLSVVNRDLQQISDEDFNRTATIMLSGIFIVLVILLKSLVMPIYIIGSLILTYIASMAFTELIFVSVLGYSGISWAVPFFGFVMLMALGVDYSIFLMGRFGENIKTLPVKEALLSAMRQIGTVILSAAIILAGTFGAMMPSGVLSLVQIGTLVLTGLLLYSLVMLPLFVPVMVRIFGDKNWLPFKRPYKEE